MAVGVRAFDQVPGHRGRACVGINVGINMTPAQTGRLAAGNWVILLTPSNLPHIGYQLQLLAGARRRTIGADAPLQKPCALHCGSSAAFMLGQYEGVVDSEGAELLAVGQEEAEVLTRQGHQLQRYRDASLGHVILQSAGRQPEAGRARADFEDQVAWRKLRIRTPASAHKRQCHEGECAQLNFYLV